MQVRVVEIMSTEPATVRFQCTAGTATAHWRGDLPTAETDYDVDWDIDPKLTWGVNAAMTGTASDLMEDQKPEVFVRGQVRSVENHGIVNVTVAGSTTLLELLNAPQNLAGQWVELHAPKLSLWP